MGFTSQDICGASDLQKMLIAKCGAYEPVNDALSYVRLFATPQTIQSMGFFRPEHWCGELFPSPGDLPNPGIEPRSPTLQVDALPAEPQGKPMVHMKYH